MYLAAPNGTLQFLTADEKEFTEKDELIRLVSTDMPVVDGAMPYTAGSEQVYKAVEVQKPWYKRM